MPKRYGAYMVLRLVAYKLCRDFLDKMFEGLPLGERTGYSGYQP